MVGTEMLTRLSSEQPVSTDSGMGRLVFNSHNKILPAMKRANWSPIMTRMTLAFHGAKKAT